MNLLLKIDTLNMLEYWDTIKSIRWKSLISKTCQNDASLFNEDIVQNGLNLEEQFNITIPLEYFQNIQDSIFDTALQTFIYLNFCPKEVFNSPWTGLTEEMIKQSSNPKLLIFLNRIKIQNDQSWAKPLLESVSEIYDLKHETIDLMANGKFSNARFNASFGENNWNLVHEISNHPVHINLDSGKSTSSLIPFCQFGGRNEDVGKKVEGFSFPVCDTFKAKVLNDQLCYEVDVNNYVNKDTSEEDLRAGLTFLVDYNEDRQVFASNNKSQNYEIKGVKFDL